MPKTVAQKMRIKEGARAIFVNAPEEAVEAIELPPLDISAKLSGDLDYIHLFAKSQAELSEHFRSLKPI
ncbi:hypothetical protein BH09BAC1_BH09BAC1_17530 [soil metagenome]